MNTAAEQPSAGSNEAEALTIGVAHDVNNLLAVIRNYANLADDSVAGDSSAHADLAQIRIAAEQAVGLTHQLLARGSADRIETEFLDLNMLVREVATMFGRMSGDNIEIAVHADPQLPAVRGDRGRFEQVLVNLVVNARDAMRDGGLLTLETGAVALVARQKRPSDLPCGEYVALVVSDTGVGMSEEVIARAVEPFFTTKPTGEGSGIGLATANSIVHDAGGQMTFHSGNGTGTTVRVYLPVDRTSVRGINDVRARRDRDRF